MKRILFVWLLTAPLWGKSQELPQVIPPAPEVAGITKYTDIPVGHYSGTAQTSIPLLQAQSRDISVPISLSYHGSGIRVEETASRIGLGWSLMAGGSISRSVRGKPDDRAVTGFLNTTATVDAFMTAYDASDQLTLVQLSNAAIGTNGVDYEPDIFNFSFMGHSGKFVFRQDGTVITIPHSDYKIEKRGTSSNIEGWTITDPNGYKYHFGNLLSGAATARSKSEILHSYVSESPTVDVDFGASFYNSWHLLKVESPMSDALVTFNYTTHIYELLTRGSQTLMWGFTGSCTNNPSGVRTGFTNTEYTEALLSSIDFENGSIDFTYGTSRDDSNGDIPLESVTLKNSSGSQIRKFEFVQDYFISDTPQGTEIPSAITVNSHITHRLRLDKIVEKGKDNVDPKETIFDYYSDAQLKLPHRFSMQQDFWGFYNGASLNTSLIPSYYNSKWKISRPGADRRVNDAYSYANALKSITYPTGGKATFNYESNSVSNSEQTMNSFFPLDTDNLKSLFYVDSGPDVLTGNFSVTADHIDGYVEYEVSRVGCTDPINSFTCGMAMEITGVTDPNFQMFLTAESGNLTLPIGDYQISVEVIGENITSSDIHIRGFKNGSPGGAAGESLVGGLRIKQILLEDGNGNTIRKELDYADPTTKLTSGKLASTKLTFAEYGVPFCTDVVNYATIPSANQLTSYSVLPMLSAGSGHVGYTRVTEYQYADKEFYDHATASLFTKEVKNGFARYQFSFTYDDPSEGSQLFPFAPYVTYDWKKGNMEKKEVFSSDRGYAEQISTESSEYDYYTTSAPKPHYEKIRGVTFGKRANSVNFAIYNTISEVFNLKQQKVEQFFENGEIEVVTDNFYDNNDYLRPSKVVSTNSQGKTTITKMYYPRDAALISELSTAEKAVLDDMVVDNMVGTPVLTETFVNNEQTPVSKQLTVYNSPASERYHPGSVKFWNRSSDTFEDRISYTFDANGNYEYLEKDQAQGVGYLWGYNNSLPIAQVTNAEPDEIYVQDFEQASGNATATPHTGKNYYNGDYLVSFTPPSSGKSYEISYWYLDGADWKLKTAPYIGSGVLLSLGSAIDDIRVYPVDAQVTTFTHEPLVGVTSQSDVNNLPVYYFYDSHNRLLYIKDQDGNIVKAFDYAYRTSTSN